MNKLLLVTMLGFACCRASTEPAKYIQIVHDFKLVIDSMVNDGNSKIAQEFPENNLPWPFCHGRNLGRLRAQKEFMQRMNAAVTAKAISEYSQNLKDSNKLKELFESSLKAAIDVGRAQEADYCASIQQT